MARFFMVLPWLVAAVITLGCTAPATPGTAEQSDVVAKGADPDLDLYRAVQDLRDDRALVQPVPATDPDRQALVWGILGQSLSVAEMPPVHPELMRQALEGRNLDVLGQLPGNAPRQHMVHALINADLAASDPHARYLPPQDVGQLDRRLRLFDEGLGIAVIESQPGIVVVSDISQGSPASEVAGLQPGSILERVQDPAGRWHSPEGPAQWRQSLSGPVGSWAGIQWRNEAGKSRKARIRRTLWSIESQRARATVVGSDAGPLGLVSLPAFYDRGDGVGTLPDLERAMGLIRARKASILVLDLRGNRGGQWRTIMDAASIVMPHGRLANALGPLERPLPVDVHGHDMAWNGPVWVWVDQHTASGGEILAGALREAVAACIVGERTFGKATMQERIDIDAPGAGQVLLSTTMYSWPSGKTAQWTGVEPDMWMSDPSQFDTTGERSYPSSLVPFSKDVSSRSPVYAHPGSGPPNKGDEAWIAASLETPQCKRK